MNLTAICAGSGTVGNIHKIFILQTDYIEFLLKLTPEPLCQI